MKLIDYINENITIPDGMTIFIHGEVQKIRKIHSYCNNSSKCIVDLANGKSAKVDVSNKVRKAHF